MTKSKIVHDTFVIERSYPQPPARVFAGFSDDEVKKRWFLPPADFATTEAYQNDFRVGGKETGRFRFIDPSPGGSPAGTLMGNDSIYMDIVDNERIVYTYSMLVADERISTSLVTIQFLAEGQGTRLSFTEQAVYYVESDAIQHRKPGVEYMLGNLAEAVA
ncbi:MAG: hypothetical protein RLZZ450_2453 [Pseudomonadota bacterium]|jgi:uncharacterized protein YndB with AHSA1/START domain